MLKRYLHCLFIIASFMVSARAMAANATLNSLGLSTGTLYNLTTLNTTFVSTDYNYAIALASGTTSIRVTPTQTIFGSTITVNGTAVVSGNQSGAIALSAGSNTITIVVTNTGNTTETYTLTVTVGPTISYTSPTYNTGAASITLSPAVTGTPASYAVTTGTLPGGLSIAAGTGVITGVPTTAATANITVTATYSGGVTATSSFIITVNASTISYASSSFTFVKGTAYTNVGTVTVTGTTPTSYSATSLPAGLTINSSGQLSGTPTATSGATAYTITAHYAGTVTATTNITITVLGAAPTIAYTSSTFDVGASVNLTPTVTGSPTGYSVTSGTLPAGLSINAGTGAITGAPTTVAAAASIQVTATYLGAASATSVTFTITIGASTISYTSPTYNVGATSITLSPTVTGTTPTSYAITSGTLPGGLSIAAGTGIITGVPTTAGAATLVVTATYSGTVTVPSASFTITINASTISYTSPTYNVGAASVTLSPAVTGTTPTSYAVTSGTLPAGLSIAAGTGVITGVPTTAETATLVVTATYAGTVTVPSASFTITVNASTISYTSPTYNVGAASITLSPAVTGTTPTSYAVTSGTLPAGLSIAAGTGVITGVPTTAGTATLVVTATYAGAVTVPSSSFTITINASTISYASSSFTFVKGTAYTNVGTVTVTGTTPTSYSATLPAGLTINSSGQLSGTPTATSGATAYTITAHYAGTVTTTTNITITVLGAVPTIVYTSSTFDVGASVNFTPTVTGSPTGYSVTSGTLPAGLSINTGTGAITGTPTTVASATSIQVTATYLGAASVTSATFTITIAASTISYTSSTYNTGAASITLSPTVTGTTPTSYAITSGTLPGGLSIAAGTGIITGVPTTAGAATLVVTATYSGSVTAPSSSFTITINASGISYAGTPFTYAANAAITSASPTVTGTTPTSYSASLPAGLSISSSGVISGTPTAVSAATPYTITANYSGGVTATTVINITVEGITYSGSPYTWYTSAPVSISPTVTGTPASYSISPTTLPAGLTFSAGVISGTPTGTATAANYTVSAVYTGVGTATTIINITVSAPGTTNWTGSSGTAWETPGNWDNGVPNADMIAALGVSTTTITNPPSISSAATCNQLILGPNATITLTINSGYSLTVSSDVIMDHNSAAGGSTATITGSGSLTCNSFTVGDNTTPPAPNGELLLGGSGPTTNSTTLNISVNSLTVNGNLTLNSTSSALGTYTFLFVFSASNYSVNNPVLNLNSGTITANNLITSNAAYVNNTDAFGATATNSTTYNMGIGTTANTLVLLGATPVTIATGAAIDFVGAGTASLATVNYAATSGTQTVYNSNDGINTSPTLYPNLTLSGAAAKTIDAGSLTVGGSFTASGGTVNMTTNNPTVTVTGNWTNSTTLNFGTGTTYFNGTAAQSLTDNSTAYTNFNNVEFENGGVKTMSGTGGFTVSPTSALTMGAGAQLAAGDVLTLLSGSSGAATVAQIPSGASITGNVNVQRYVTGNTSLSYRGYRLLSSPVNITSPTSSTTGGNYISLNTLNSTYTVAGTAHYGLFTGGPGGTSSGFSFANPNPVLYFYKESLAASNTTFTSGNNVGVDQINATTVKLSDGSTYSIPVGNGFLAYFIGSTNGRTSGSTSLVPDNTTFTNVGYLNQQNINVYLWYTPTGGAGKLSYSDPTTAFKGYNMVGNPYASTLDLKQVYTDNTGSISGAFYELSDVTAPGNYVSYNGASNTTSGAGASEYVESGQGFFVVATGTTSTLTFKETEKPATVTFPTTPILAARPGGIAGTNASTADSSARQHIDALPPVAADENAGLHLRMEKDSIVFDDCGVYFKNGWSDNFDYYDSFDIDGTSPQVYMSSFTADGVRASINALGSYTQGKRIKLYVKATTTGLFNLTMTDMANIDTADFSVYLIDNLKKDSLDIGRYKTYNFNINTSDTTTFGANRFVLAIEKKSLQPYQLISFTAQKVTGGVLLTWTTSNEGDYTTFGIQKQDGSSTQYNTLYTVQSNGQGTYTYTDPNPINGNNTYRLMQNDIESATTYSNPVNIWYNITVSPGVLTVYPNPAHEVITVNFNSATMTNSTYLASIYNSLGALMMQTTVNSNSWSQDVSSLKPGAYIVKVTASNGTSVGNAKFIKYQ